MRTVSSRLLNLLARRCDLALAVSESVAQDARRCLPARLPLVSCTTRWTSIVLRPDGPFSISIRCRVCRRRRLRTLRVGLPATFARWKGHDAFLAAWRSLTAENVRAYVIGGPVYRPGTASGRRPSSLGIGRGSWGCRRASVSRAGRDMPAAYRALDVVVHASTGRTVRPGHRRSDGIAARRCGGADRRRRGTVRGRRACARGRVRQCRGAGGCAARLIADPAGRVELGRRARAHVLERSGASGSRPTCAWRCPASSRPAKPPGSRDERPPRAQREHLRRRRADARDAGAGDGRSRAPAFHLRALLRRRGAGATSSRGRRGPSSRGRARPPDRRDPARPPAP